MPQFSACSETILTTNQAIINVFIQRYCLSYCTQNGN